MLAYIFWHVPFTGGSATYQISEVRWLIAVETTKTGVS